MCIHKESKSIITPTHVCGWEQCVCMIRCLHPLLSAALCSKTSHPQISSFLSCLPRPYDSSPWCQPLCQISKYARTRAARCLGTVGSRKSFVRPQREQLRSLRWPWDYVGKNYLNQGGASLGWVLMKFKFAYILHEGAIRINSRSSALLNESSYSGSTVVMEILVFMQR